MKKITVSALLLAGLFLITACGQKGPLILDELPTGKTQAPLESANDVIPVEQEVTESESE